MYGEFYTISPSYLDTLNNRLQKLSKLTDKNISISIYDNTTKKKKKNKSKYILGDDDMDVIMNTSKSDIRKTVSKYYYKKTLKWLKEDDKFKSLLKYIKVDDNKCNISKDNNDEVTDKNINEKINCFKQRYDKNDFLLLLIKFHDKYDLEWSDIDNKDYKKKIKKFIHKQLKKMLSKS